MRLRSYVLKYKYRKHLTTKTAVTALTWCVVMATRMHCTDLVLLWHEHRPNPWATYIYTALPLYIDPHTTSFVNHTQYLVPRRHVLWQLLWGGVIYLSTQSLLLDSSLLYSNSQNTKELIYWANTLLVIYVDQP